MVRSLSRICGRGALLLTLGGCDRGAPRVGLRITHYEHVSSAATGPHLERESVAFSAGTRYIQVEGTITLPDHCDILRAGLEMDPPEVELRLHARKNDEPDERCDDSDRSVIVQYVARLDSLPPAQYDLRVVYDTHASHSRRRGESDPAIERILLRQPVTVR